VYPASTADVREIVRIANKHRVTLYSFALARTGGTASGAPSGPDVIVDVGARMKRILEIDERLCFAAIEPGVTYQQMYDELGRRGHVLMMDTTSGPPEGGIVGNTLDKGAGYTPYFDHFGMSCGLEVVLGDGRILRTADGAFPGAQTWHIANCTGRSRFHARSILIAYGTGAGARRNSLRRTTRQSTNGSWPSTVIHRKPRCSPAAWCGS